MPVATNHTLLGVFAGGPDNSSASNDAATVQQYNGFVSTMGQTPTMMDTYVDGTIPESTWVGDAYWAADSWKQDAWAQGLIPVIGIPMAANGEDADQSFRNIASGSEDSIFNGIFQAWASDGYTQQYIRPGFEMNGTWMPWSVNSANAGDYVAAFQRIASLAHAFTGASIQVVWNPNVGGAVPMGGLYPGNTAVDIVGLDTYGAPINNDASPTDTSTDPNDFTLNDALALAKANGKPFALPETGGANASFPTALANVVAQSGVQVAFVNMWDINNSDGPLSWSNPGENQATAAAWKAAFQTIANASNALSDTTTPAPVPASVPVLAPPVLAPPVLAPPVLAPPVAALGPTPDPVAAPSVPAPSVPAPGPTGAPSANDTVVLAGSTAAITDAGGNAWTITGDAQVATNGAVDPVTWHVTELATVDGTIWQENSDNMWWGETTPDGSWANTPGTATSPLPTTITIPENQGSTSVGLSQVSVVATAGDQMLFISGSGDSVTLSGGTDTITDTGGGNRYVMPTAGHGYDAFTSNILTASDTLDLGTALGATDWNGATSTLANYLSVTDTTSGAELSIAAVAGGPGVAIASISGATAADLTAFLSHTVT